MKEVSGEEGVEAAEAVNPQDVKPYFMILVLVLLGTLQKGARSAKIMGQTVPYWM
jgi:hypothetical protein